MVVVYVFSVKEIFVVVVVDVAERGLVLGANVTGDDDDVDCGRKTRQKVGWTLIPCASYPITGLKNALGMIGMIPR